MLIENETQDSNPESEQDTNSENESDDISVKLTKTEEVAKNQKIRAEKAEAENKRLKAESAKSNKTEESETSKNKEQPNEPDYYKDLTLRTFMKGEGVDTKVDQDWLLKESQELNKPVEDLLSKPYYQSELKSRKTQREAEDGMPDGSGKSSGGAKNDLDYWIDKTNPKNPEEYLLPKQHDLKVKVIKARLEKFKRKQEFPDE
jgi:hypothetical protein